MSARAESRAWTEMKEVVQRMAKQPRKPRNSRKKAILIPCFSWFPWLVFKSLGTLSNLIPKKFGFCRGGLLSGRIDS